MLTKTMSRWCDVCLASTFAMLLSSIVCPSSASIDTAERTLPNCRSALGMESRGIPDHAITASSSFVHKSVGPHNGRIRTDQNGGAWCPNTTIRDEVQEWLQIYFGELKVITAVETQGRYGKGDGKEFTPHYMLQYQRIDGGRWMTYKDKKGKQILTGNKNMHEAVQHDLDPPMIARRVRFVPYSKIMRMVCMRVELHGCTWKGGVIAYNMRQGDTRSPDIDLTDLTYDGSVTGRRLTGGLGQLLDWEVGGENFRLDIDGVGHRGYEWVGWRNDTDSTAVTIDFIFDRMRNVSAIHVHCSNQFSRAVSVFRSADISVSRDRRRYGSPVHFAYPVDRAVQAPRWVQIPLPNLVGTALRLQMFFDKRWILVSEVHIDSTVAVGNFTNDLLHRSDMDWSRSKVAPVIIPTILSPTGRGMLPGKPTSKDLPVADGDGAASGRNKTSMTGSHAKNSLDDTYIGVIIGVVAALVILVVVILVIVFVRQRRKFTSSPHKLFEANHMNFNLNDLTPNLVNAKLSHGNVYNSIATLEPVEVKNGSFMKINNGDLFRELTDDTAHDADIATDTESELRDCCASPTDTVDKFCGALVVNLPPTPVFHSNAAAISDDSPPPPTPPPPHFRAFPTNIQAVMGGTFYLDRSDGGADVPPIAEFPRENLQFVEKLGDGHFGEVDLCEAVRVSDFLPEDYLPTDHIPSSMMVTVKILHNNADEDIRLEFEREVRVLSRVSHPNLARVLGVCSSELPLSVVSEHMKHGDLRQYLLHREPAPEHSLTRTANHKIVSYGGLIYMAGQIAFGMKYLESLDLVHRDLAARNCLVGHHLAIKISDFGISRQVYSADYCRLDGRSLLPIRWMSWESVLLGKFSSKSDVWSFAVTLWEILTFGRQQPFSDLSDERVVENCGHYCRGNGVQRHLAAPASCAKEIYDLMRECWNRDEARRPTFREVHMFLQRKNMGYSPRDDLQMGAGLSY